MNYYNLLEKEIKEKAEEREEPETVNLSNWFRVNK
jgi:hypothetical protein